MQKAAMRKAARSQPHRKFAILRQRVLVSTLWVVESGSTRGASGGRRESLGEIWRRKGAWPSTCGHRRS